MTTAKIASLEINLEIKSFRIFSGDSSLGIILKSLISRFISKDDILAVVIRDNKLVLNFNQNGYDKVQEILKEKKFILNQLLVYFLKEET